MSNANNNNVNPADNYLDGDYIPDHLDGIEIDGALTEDKFRAVGIELQLSFDERTDKHVGFLISFNEAKDLLARLTNN
jgi:hypothetical protein